MQVTIPNLGDGVDKADVIGILVSVGDSVEADQTLVELETDKAVAPVPSPSAGVVKEILIKEGDKVGTGSRIMVFEGCEASETKTEQTNQKTQTSAPIPQAIQQPVIPPTPQIQATYIEPYSYDAEAKKSIATAPSIRAAAHAFGIDLTRVQGTGKGGRIVASDIFQYIQNIQSLAFNNSQSNPVDLEASAPKGPKPLEIDFSKWGDVEIENVTSLRTKIAKKMAESWQTVPHVTQFGKLDMTDLMAFRKKLNPKYQKKGAKLTVTVFVIKAIVDALQEFPNFNASYDQAKGELIRKKYYNIGVAVDTPSGLIVPVIRDVDKKSYLELALEVNEIAQKARDRKIGMEDLQGGTFTVSNLGGLGAGQFTPIVNTPEVAIIGLSAGEKIPTFIDGKIEERMVMPLSLSYDHRVIDGADGARFMSKVIDTLNNITEKDLKI